MLPLSVFDWPWTSLQGILVQRYWFLLRAFTGIMKPTLFNTIEAFACENQV